MFSNISYRALICAILPSLPLLAISPSFADHVLPETISVELTFRPNLENGARVYEVCESCHLPDGWGNRDGVYPQLAGQQASVLMQQLLDIRSGERDNPVMYPFVQERTIGGYQNLADVVAYISTLPMTDSHGKGEWDISSPEYAQGESLYQNKCASCHGELAQGNYADKTPRLQGQHYAYLQQQVKLITAHRRKTHPGMLAVVKTLALDEVDKVLNYISRIPVPDSDLAKPEDAQ